MDRKISIFLASIIGASLMGLIAVNVIPNKLESTDEREAA